LLDPVLVRELREPLLGTRPVGLHREALFPVPVDAVDDVGEDEPQAEPFADRDRLCNRIVVFRAIGHGADQGPVHLRLLRSR
jgi:hypothetical protein